MAGKKVLRIRQWLAVGLVACYLIAVPAEVLAAVKKEKKPPQPIEIVADEMYFSDQTGELFARGNVQITQGETVITADYLRGNDKQTEIWVDGKARFKEPLTDVSGMKIRYHYGSKFGQMQDVSGKCGDDFISGEKVSIQPGKYTVYGATTTGCKMQGTPDYRVTARKVEIWPNEKVIAHDAKVWIKNTVLYSTPRYRRSLKKRDQDDEFPRFGYQDSDGFWIGQKFSYALDDNWSAYLDMLYYTKWGFRPHLGLVNQQKDYLLQVTTGRFRDDNSNWIRKEPELQFNLYPRPIGQLPLKYTFNVLIGQWIDDTKSSWHQDYKLYVSHDPIYFDAAKSWRLNLGTGLQHIRESYNQSYRNVYRYNIGLSKKISPALTAWAGYNYTDNTATSFDYGRVEVGKEGVLGLAWQINNRTRISYYTSYDFANSRTYENYYGLRQSFHCWEMDIIYRSVKKELIWLVNVVRW